MRYVSVCLYGLVGEKGGLGVFFCLSGVAADRYFRIM
jgi:hypothetical protein